MRIYGTLTFTTKQKRDSALSKWNTAAQSLGWAGTATTVGATSLEFVFTYPTASDAEVDTFAEDTYRFCHANGLTEGWMSVEPPQ